MNQSYILLGKYAILQHRLSAQLTERRKQKALPTETERLVGLTEGSQDNLFVAKTVFPFVFFADTLKIDRQKITIVHNDFLWKAQTASTEIKNIMNIEASTGPLFGSLTVTSKHFLNNTQTIRYLRKKDVARAQRLLQGFMIAQRANIDTDNIESKQLLALLNNLGQENRR